MLFRLFTVLAVVALAVSTWILSSPAHRPLTPSGAGAPELPGYYLKSAVLSDFDATGIPGLHLTAERIDQIDHSSEVTLANVQVDYQAPGKQNWVLFSDFAQVESGGKIIDMTSNVRLQGEGGARAGTTIVRTDALTYDVSNAVVSTKSDVRIEFGAHTLTAQGLVANLKERTMHLENKVNGRFIR